MKGQTMSDEISTATAKPESDPFPLQKKATQSDLIRAGIRNGMSQEQIEKALKDSGMT
jgi:hypothetical protein